MSMESISGSAQSKDAGTAEDPMMALFREHSTRVRAQVEAARPGRRKKSETFSSTLAKWISLTLTVPAHRLVLAAGEEGLSLEILQKLAASVVALRKGDQAEVRMELARERLEIARELTEERMEARFDQWLDEPEIMERFRPKPKMSPEEKERRIKAVFGITDDQPPWRQPKAQQEGQDVDDPEDVGEEEDEDEDEEEAEDESDESSPGDAIEEEEPPLEGDAPSAPKHSGGKEGTGGGRREGHGGNP
jgi:hypothetical protein